MKQSKRMACLLTAGSRNWAFIALIAAFFIGIIMGSIFNYNADESSRGLLIQFAESIFNRQAIDRTVVNALAINFTYFFLIFVSGLAAPGFIIVMFLPFVKGFSFGYTTAFIFSNFGSGGYSSALLVFCHRRCYRRWRLSWHRGWRSIIRWRLYGV